MQTTTFTTAAPYDHVPRALDIMRKMGFVLHRLSVDEVGEGFVVEMAFAAPQLLSINILRHRLSQIDGIDFAETLAPLESDTDETQSQAA